jgi:LPS-assembly lipoprotein
MSSSSLANRQRRAFQLCRAFALAAMLGGGLGACGFEPLYGDRGHAGEGATAEIASVRIAPIADRTGQQLYNFLRDRLNPRGIPDDPRYMLAVTLEEDTEALAVQRDETATRVNLTLEADFVLLDVPSGKRVFRGRSRSTTSYDILRAQYATLVAASDARRRSARDLSDDIANQVALFVAGQPYPTATAE